MAEPAGRGRSALRLPRVEFDLAALLLGTVATVAYAFFWPAMAAVLQIAPVAAGTPSRPVTVPPAVVLRGGFFTQALERAPMPGLRELAQLLGNPAPVVRASATDPKAIEVVRMDVAGWKCAVTAAALLLLWSVVVGALARVYALRKARDTSIRFDDALAFSLGSLRQFLLAPAFTLAAVALFAALTIGCGALAAVPWAGPVLQVFVQPLAVLLGVVLAVMTIGLVFGFPMMTAAVAVERGGSLDAVSRTFSYVWTRPLTWVVATGLVLVGASLVSAVGTFALHLGESLFGAGASHVAPSLAGQMRAAVEAAGTFRSPTLPGGLSLPDTASVWVAWSVGAVAAALVRGLVVSYAVGGIVDVYFLLREEVDQVDGSEVFVESDAATLGEPVPEEPKAG